MKPTFGYRECDIASGTGEAGGTQKGKLQAARRSGLLSYCLN